ncbi:MAG: putative N-acetyltransferase [Cyanobacteria bacterium RYN_339]|nr:putative N-acetyltransferase [Cyanobacteria bacterium RYN_339]
MAPYTVHEAVPSDRPFARKMLELAALQTYGDLAGLGRISLRERLDEIFERHYAHDRKRIWIAKAEEGLPVGLVWIQPGHHPVTEQPDYLVLNLAVELQHRGQGVARMLMLSARAYAEGRGVRRLRLFVAADNQPAVQLYEALGFAERTREMVWIF